MLSRLEIAPIIDIPPEASTTTLLLGMMDAGKDALNDEFDPGYRRESLVDAVDYGIAFLTSPPSEQDRALGLLKLFAPIDPLGTSVVNEQVFPKASKALKIIEFRVNRSGMPSY